MESAEEGFSPLRVARAGRRAGRTVAIAEPEATSSSTTATTSSSHEQGSSALSLQEGPLQHGDALGKQDLAQQHGKAQQQGWTQEPALETKQQEQQPVAQLQHQQQAVQPLEASQLQPQPQSPPVKRVGFALDEPAGASAAAAAPGKPTTTGVSRRKQEQLQREEEVQAKHRNKYDEKLVDALADVPELEEMGKEDITRIVAQAPKATAPTVQAISELDSDQAWMPAQPERSTDINLSMLTACLLPSAQVVEPPDVWDYDLLFSQLKAELQNKAGDNSSSGANAPEDPILA